MMMVNGLMLWRRKSADENPRNPEPYWYVVVGCWFNAIRSAHSNTGCDTMRTKDVLVTVRLTVADSVVIEDLISDMGYQFTYTDYYSNELIMDSEMTNAVEINNG
jgi:hypothetical protein